MTAECAQYRFFSTLSNFIASKTTNCYRQVCLRFKYYFVHWKSTMGTIFLSLHTYNKAFKSLFNGKCQLIKILAPLCKVHVFWEGHYIRRNLQIFIEMYKGQLNSKCISVSSILPKNHRQNSTILLSHLKLNCFRSFLGELKTPIRHFKSTDL